MEISEVSFDIKLSPEDLYRFNMYQNYTSLNGIVSILIGIISFVMAGIAWDSNSVQYMFLYIIVGIIILLYIPVTLWGRAKRTIKTNKVLAGTLHYTLTQKAVRVMQEDQEGELPWDQIYKMVCTGRQVLIYSSRINAYIIPKEQLGEKFDDVVGFARKQLPPYRFKAK